MTLYNALNTREERNTAIYTSLMYTGDLKTGTNPKWRRNCKKGEKGQDRVSKPISFLSYHNIRLVTINYMYQTKLDKVQRNTDEEI